MPPSGRVKVAVALPMLVLVAVLVVVLVAVPLVPRARQTAPPLALVSQ
jgi:hypothetical protein